MKTVFMGGKQAGYIGLLTLCATGNRPSAVVAYSRSVDQLAVMLGLPVYGSLHGRGITARLLEMQLSVTDLLVSVHGREIVSGDLLAMPKYGGINVHPCLSDYPGANPVERYVNDGQTRPASVGVHRMTSVVDGGEVLVEEFVDIPGPLTVEGVYNELYPYYATALIKALEVV